MSEEAYDLEEYNLGINDSRFPRVRKETLDIPGSPDKSSLNFEIEDEKEEHKYSEELPPIPIGRFCTSIFFFICGIGLIIAGFVQEHRSPIPAGGLPFWVVGALVLIPASYCVYELTRAMMARTPLERLQILNDIPEI